MTLTTTQKSIQELLHGDRQYQIPDFQRPYVWEEQQAETLVNDLLGAWRTNDGDYFLGSIVLVQHTSCDDVDIIDGQQRLTTLCILVSLLRHLEEDSALRENKTETSFKDVFSILIKNDQLLWVAIAYLVFVLGQNVINNFNLYYFIYVLGDAKQFSFLGVINVIIGLLAVALFPTLTEKFSRRRLFFGSVAVMLLGIVLYAMAGTSVLMTLFAAGLFALPQPLIFLVVLMTITDTVEYGQLKLGHRDEALVLCVRPLVDKLAGAIASGLIGLTAIWVGMTSGATAATITPENLFNFKLVMFALPFVFILLGTILYRAKVTLTEAEHARIVEELEEKWDEMNK